MERRNSNELLRVRSLSSLLIVSLPLVRTTQSPEYMSDAGLVDRLLDDKSYVGDKGEFEKDSSERASERRMLLTELIGFPTCSFPIFRSGRVASVVSVVGSSLLLLLLSLLPLLLLLP